MRILLTGGGTAGHGLPVILVAESLLKNKRNQILYVGSRQGTEKDLALKFKIPFKAIIVGKRRVYFSLANVWDFIKTFIGFFQSFFILLFFRPNVIFAKGGYVTVPIIFWLRFFKIPLVIHESDVVMGRANLWALKFAQKVCLGFPIEYYQQNLPLEKLTYTGIPVQRDFSETAIKTGDRLKILITGGSQGSSKINGLVQEILTDLLKKYEIWHLSGQRDYSRLLQFQKTSLNNNPFYHLFEFTYLMPKFMRDADLVVSRAGANTLAEISASGKPAIIIPLSTAANEHQAANAQVYFKLNAAVVVSEENLTSNSLLAIIENLLSDEKMRKLLGHHGKSLFQPESVEEIINAIFEVAKK